MSSYAVKEEIKKSSGVAQVSSPRETPNILSHYTKAELLAGLKAARSRVARPRKTREVKAAKMICRLCGQKGHTQYDLGVDWLHKVPRHRPFVCCSSWKSDRQMADLINSVLHSDGTSYTPKKNSNAPANKPPPKSKPSNNATSSFNRSPYHPQWIPAQPLNTKSGDQDTTTASVCHAPARAKNTSNKSTPPTKGLPS